MSSRSLHGHPRELTVVFSDASAPGAGVHVTIDDVEQVSICRWSESEAAKGATFRELLGVWRCIKNFGHVLREKLYLHEIRSFGYIPFLKL